VELMAERLALQVGRQILVGSKKRLAVALDLSVAELERYLNGEALPHKVFIQALDIVAGSCTFSTVRTAGR
jgi:hypothetical protein